MWVQLTWLMKSKSSEELATGGRELASRVSKVALNMEPCQGELGVQETQVRVNLRSAERTRSAIERRKLVEGNIWGFEMNCARLRRSSQYRNAVLDRQRFSKLERRVRDTHQTPQ